MAHPDSHLTGGIMAMIVMALVFDDDENGPVTSPSGDEADSQREEEGHPDRPRRLR